ncbi:MAG: non-heme iron oxygenase ferredoxin subunit [Acidimicrobiales bacterium]|jgi:3-phenylpropionate/trans-cinnamate dioxygenase ferredoxin subunit|nr:non-heme iron oxygenase ferredoxin subunit [Acidimicrobiales bacterium]MDP6298768.1 non-heme iron oxygenase ferredoxin subunit [Acidimicrobiales bacterium]HJL64548.1 non-heme iron oxygenase ferredoxin subunit [Candidatus Thalassarchaeaceae archaeon]HJM28537.1 non-heme iron oxygenase ferredoxin subunit [Acidimicrobiales bacterium]
MTSTSNDSHELGNLDDLQDGEMRVFEDIGDYGIVVCRVNGELYAIEDNCSHADTPLSEGRLRSHNLTCPLHGTSFDVRTGEHSGPPAYEGVSCFRIQIDDGVAVALPSTDEKDPNTGFGGVGGIFQTR